MGRLRARTDYENLRATRMLENQTRLASLGVQTTVSELRSVASSEKSERTSAKKTQKSDKFRAMKRRSARLEGKSYNFTPYTRGNGTAGGFERREQVCGEEDIEQCADLDNNETCTDKDDVRDEKDYETQRKLRISENQARLASLGLQKTISELRSIISSGKQERAVRKWIKFDYSSATKRRSNRLKGISCDKLLSLQGESYDFEETYVKNKKRLKDSAFSCAGNGLVSRLSPEAMARCCTSIGRGSLYDGIYGVCCHSCREQVCGEEDIEQCADLDNNEMCTDKDDVREENDYETQRKLRISENQARLASLGLQKTIAELRSIVSSGKQERTPVRKCVKVDYSSATLRRSDRLKGISCDKLLSFQGESDDFEESDVKNKKRLKGSGSLCARNGLVSRLSLEAMARRCTNKGRGSLYDGTYGICCHSCRQKKLCGEEDCKHCGNLDVKEPCIGKTECSVCRSSNGVFCRGCLKVRYGEEMDDVRKNKQWMCPHCVEEKGVRPNWICNSSICLNKRKMVPTGIAIFKAREMGYESVAHLLMDKLSKAEQRRRGASHIKAFSI